MILSKTVLKNMKKSLRTMSDNQLLSILNQQKLILENIINNDNYSQVDAFSYRQKIALIEEELKQRSCRSTQEI